MPNTKISALPSTTLAGTETVPVASGGTNYGVTAAAIAALKAPAGSTTQVQYNASGAFAGDSGFMYDSTNKNVYINNTMTAQISSANAYVLNTSGVVTDANTFRILSTSDNGKIIYFSNTAQVTVNTSNTLLTGFSCTMIQGNTGQISVNSGPATVVASFGGLTKSVGQYSMVSIICPVANTFILGGNLGS